jgi:hypothetical protein
MPLLCNDLPALNRNDGSSVSGVRQFALGITTVQTSAFSTSPIEQAIDIPPPTISGLVIAKD